MAMTRLEERGTAALDPRELRAALERPDVRPLSEMPDALLEEEFGDLHRAGELLEARKLQRLSEIEHRGSFAHDGHLTVSSWLVDRFKMAWGKAKEQVRLARGLEAMPAVQAALHDGEVSLSAVSVLAHARETDPEAFSDSEPMLLGAARLHSVKDLARVVLYWRDAVEAERGLADQAHERRFARRRLHASPTMHGMVRVDGDLDPESGEALLTALSAVMDAEARSSTAGEADASAFASSHGEPWPSESAAATRAQPPTATSR
jgi:hypothetical protein